MTVATGRKKEQVITIFLERIFSGGRVDWLGRLSALFRGILRRLLGRGFQPQYKQIGFFGLLGGRGENGGELLESFVEGFDLSLIPGGRLTDTL